MKNYVKIGAGHAWAMFRQGFSELRNLFYPESNVSQQPEYGIVGTRTPGEVAESRRPEPETISARSSTLGGRLQTATREAPEARRGGRDFERE